MSCDSIRLAKVPEFIRHKFTSSVCSKGFDDSPCFLFNCSFEFSEFLECFPLFSQEYCPHISGMIIDKDKDVPFLRGRGRCNGSAEVSMYKLKRFLSSI